MVSVLDWGSVMSSLSQRCPCAIDATSSARLSERMGRASVAPYLVGVVLEHAGADETSVLVRLNGASTVQIAGG
jgi:hypothetical protein